MDLINIKNIIEVALLSAGKPLSMDDLNNILEDEQISGKSELKKIMTPTEYESFVERIPEDWNRNEIYPVEMGGITIHVKLDDV